MYQITVEDEFSAAHFLRLYDGSWEDRHGHLWKVAVILEARNLDSMGVVADFEMVKPGLREVLSELEATCLNEHPRFKSGKVNSSTENIARLIYDGLREKIASKTKARIVRVTVWETPDASASFVA